MAARALMKGTFYAAAPVLARATRAVATTAAGRSFSTYKSSTGLVGLAVDKNGRDTLLNLSAQVLESVKVGYHQAPPPALRESIESAVLTID